MKKIASSLFLVLVLMAILFPSYSLAAKRDIYIGDLIKLKIEGNNLSQEEIKNKFKEFEIDSLKEVDGGYQIVFRSFETGKKTIKLGDKTLEINIKSTLDQFKRDDIFRGDLKVKKARSFSLLKYIIMLIILILVVGVLIYFYKLVQNKISKEKSPDQEFRERIDNLAGSDKRYFAKLTFILKDYLEKEFKLVILGKTSSEIIEEISQVDQLDNFLDDLRNWLEFSEIYKYTDKKATEEIKKNKAQELLEIGKRIKGG